MDKELPILEKFQNRSGVYDLTFDLMRYPLPDTIAFDFLNPIQRARQILKAPTCTPVRILRPHPELPWLALPTRGIATRT